MERKKTICKKLVLLLLVCLAMLGGMCGTSFAQENSENSNYFELTLAPGVGYGETVVINVHKIVNSIVLPDGDSLGFEKNRFDFVGWSTDRLQSEPDYLPGEVFTVTEDTTLHATWKYKAIPFWYVTVFANWGTDGGITFSLEEDTVHELGDHTSYGFSDRFQFKFEGWTMDSKNQGKIYYPGDTIQISDFADRNDMRLYGKWTVDLPNFYMVHLNNSGYGGTQHELLPGIPEGDQITLGHPSDYGMFQNLHIFAYWYEKTEDGKEDPKKRYEAGTVLKDIDRNYTLYPKWVFSLGGI